MYDALMMKMDSKPGDSREATVSRTHSQSSSHSYNNASLTIREHEVDVLNCLFIHDGLLKTKFTRKRITVMRFPGLQSK